MEATEDHPEGQFEASRDPSTSYDGGHTVLPAMARVFSLLGALTGILTPLAAKAGGPSEFAIFVARYVFPLFELPKIR